MKFRSALILSLILSGSIILWALVNPLLPGDSSWSVMLLMALIGMDFAAVFYFSRGRISTVGGFGPLVEVFCYGILILFCLVRVII